MRTGHATTPFELFRRGKVWHYRFSHGGRQYRASTGATEETSARRTAQAEWERITHPPTSAAPTRNPAKDDPQAVFSKFVADLETLGRAPATLINYELYAERYAQFFQNKPLGLLRRDDIESWRDWMLSQKRGSAGRYGNPSETWSAKYVSEHLNWLATVFKAFDLPSPLEHVTRPQRAHSDAQKAMQVFSREELRLLLLKAGSTLRPALTFLAYTGCRAGEMTSIRESDLSPDTQMVSVIGKGSKRRALTLSGPAQPAWDAIQAERRKRGKDPIFCQSEELHRRRIVALCRELNIPPRGCHAIRHTFASLAAQYWGWDLYRLSKWLGHKSVAFTAAQYGHFFPEEPPKIEI